jgi:hypothetical protein
VGSLCLVSGFLAGCSEDNHPVRPDTEAEETPFAIEGLKTPDVEGTITRESAASTPPPGLVTVSFGSSTLSLWPYTGSSFDGTPSDPVNVIFVGQADPLQIRAALLSLNGDRTAFGFPDAYPFNAVWSEAIGDVQTAYAGDEGWSANYVQLQLGTYEPVRAHLRLFETASPFGNGVWTVGAAHFEVMIPGTADHQVLQWELAEQLVTVDMMRSGLLDPSMPLMPSGPIHAAPTFREIPAVIYNGLPPELQQLVLGPGAPPQVTDPVGIPTDGQATIFQLATAVPIPPGSWNQSFTLTYQQVVPKPFCNDGTQYVLVTGPVTFEKNARLLVNGRYRYESRYQGRLTITPWDVMTNQPAGAPYPAEVGGLQDGTAFRDNWTAQAKDMRFAREPGGVEFLVTSLLVHGDGPKHYQQRTHCLD